MVYTIILHLNFYVYHNIILYCVLVCNFWPVVCALKFSNFCFFAEGKLTTWGTKEATFRVLTEETDEKATEV